MDRLILTIVCGAGVVAAAVLSFRFGGLAVRHDAAEPVADEQPQRLAQARRFLRGYAVSVLSGITAGVLAAGLGGRLLMRVLAATSPTSAQGVQTAADETVGQITFGGTAFLVLFIGLFAGPIFGIAYRVLRRWLPATGATAGITITAIPAAVFGRASDLINPNNLDFDLLRPKLLSAFLVLAVVLLFGATLGATHEWLDRHLPLPGWSVGGVLPYLIAAIAFVDPALIPLAVAGFAVAFLIPIGVTDVAVRPAVLRRGQLAVGGLSVAAAAFVLRDLLVIAT